MSARPEADTDAAPDDGAIWDTSFAEWSPGPGNIVLRAYSDAVNKRLLGRWLPERCDHVLKTDLFDEVAGDGLVRFLLARAERVVGIDIAEAVVRAASARHPRLEALTADVRSLPYADATFDVVVSTSTLDHFDSDSDLTRALAELHRVLRPGGVLIVTLDNASNPLVALRNMLPYNGLHRLGVVPYPTGVTHGLDGLRDRVDAAGFVVADVTTIMHMPRLVVRCAGPALVGNPARVDRLLGALLRSEPPSPVSLGKVSGQFVAVRAVRQPLDASDRPRAPGTLRSPTPFSGGVRAVAMRVLGRTFYRRLIWMELRLDQMPPETAASVPLEFEFLGEDAIADITAFRPELRATDLVGRFARGDRCFGAYRAGRLVSASWIATGVAPIEYLGVVVRLPRDTAYFYDRFTDPRTRGLRVAPAAGSALCRVLADEGFVNVTAAVHPDNATALTHATRFGLRPVGRVSSLRIGPIRRRSLRRTQPCS